MLLAFSTTTLLIALAAALGLGLLLWLAVKGMTAQREIAWGVERLRRDHEESRRSLEARLSDALQRGEVLEAHLPRLAGLEPKIGQVASDARALLTRLSEFEAGLAEQGARLTTQEQERERGVAERLHLLGQVGALDQRVGSLSDALAHLAGELGGHVRGLAQRVEELERRAGLPPRRGAGTPAAGGAATPAPRAAPVGPVAPAAPPTPHYVLPPAPARPVGGSPAPAAPATAAPRAPVLPRPVRLTAAGALALLALAAFVLVATHSF